VNGCTESSIWFFFCRFSDTGSGKQEVSEIPVRKHKLKEGWKKGGMRMRRLMAILLTFSLVFCFSACGKTTSSSSQSDSSSDSGGDVTSSGGTQEADSTSTPLEPAPELNLITGEPLAAGQSAGMRPVAVMVNNAQPAMPQRGIGSADAIFEMVTEGGITRLLALYADSTAVPRVGPVRSARDQHLQFAIPLDAIIVHIGASVYAENLLTVYHYPTIDGLYLVGSIAFQLDEARKASGYAQEHCWYTDASLIAAGMEKNSIPASGASQPLFNFAPAGTKPALTGQANGVSFSFSETAPVTLQYDSATGRYAKTAFGAPQIDETTGEQLYFDNVVILFTDVKLKNPDDPNNLVTDFAMGGGSGYYFCNGEYEPITWRKGNPEDALRLFDASGSDLTVATGKSYIAVVGNDREATLVIDTPEVGTE